MEGKKEQKINAIANQVYEDFLNKATAKINDKVDQLRISLLDLINQEKESMIEKIKNTVNFYADEEGKRKKQLELLSQKKILLDVGGVYFTTSISTLTKYSNSKLAKLFSGNFLLECDSEGRFFIDRNGKYFEYILDSLRNEKLTLPQSDEAKNSALEEFKFFELFDLIEPINQQMFSLDPNCIGSSLKLSNNNMTVTKNEDKSHRSVLGTVKMSEGIYSWEVYIDSLENDHWISIGVCDKNEISKNLDGCDYGASYNVSSREQHYRTEGTLPRIKTGNTYSCSLNFSLDLFIITGPNGLNIKNKESFKGKDLYVFLNLYSLGNKLTIRNFTKIK